jgi:hypothetical protein
LNVGDDITNERGEPHQLIALEDSEGFEVSTRHYHEDSFRIHKGNYTDEHSKWDKSPTEICLLIDLSVTLLLNI